VARAVSAGAASSVIGSRVYSSRCDSAETARNTSQPTQPPILTCDTARNTSQPNQPPILTCETARNTSQPTQPPILTCETARNTSAGVSTQLNCRLSAALSTSVYTCRRPVRTQLHPQFHGRKNARFDLFGGPTAENAS